MALPYARAAVNAQEYKKINNLRFQSCSITIDAKVANSIKRVFLDFIVIKTWNSFIVESKDKGS